MGHDERLSHIILHFNPFKKNLVFTPPSTLLFLFFFCTENSQLSLKLVAVNGWTMKFYSFLSVSPFSWWHFSTDLEKRMRSRREDSAAEIEIMWPNNNTINPLPNSIQNHLKTLKKNSTSTLFSTFWTQIFQTYKVRAYYLALSQRERES